MYSPKIDESLIPHLYRIAKARNIPMTKLVSEILAKAVKRMKDQTISPERSHVNADALKTYGG